MWTWADVNEEYLNTLADNYPALTKFIASIGKIHSKAMMAYLTYMAQRIVEMHRVLKSTGSLYLHCDPTASHCNRIKGDRPMEYLRLKIKTREDMLGKLIQFGE